MKKISVVLMFLGTLFCVCLIASNFLETKVIKLGVITVTAGMLIFPISYILNDCIVEVWGYKKARLIIWLGFAMNFLVLIFGGLAALLPSPDYWEGEEAFNFVFGLAPRITLASLAAFLIGSFLNAYIMSRMKVATKGKGFSLRAILSTIAGESADSIIFFPIAFAGLMPFNELVKMMIVQACLKTLYEIIALPITVRVVRIVKTKEGIDVFDDGISYGIFTIKDL